MVTVIAFHSVLGLRPGVLDFAETLRGDGHTVYTPDLWDGIVYDTMADALAHRDRLGMSEIIGRSIAAVAELPSDSVYLGYSLGAACAQLAAQTRPGARGAVLFHGVLTMGEAGAPWPAGVPVQAHTMDHDGWVDLEETRATIAGIAAVAPAELFVYPGSGHLFTDPDSADFDAGATAAAHSRVRAFLAALD